MLLLSDCYHPCKGNEHGLFTLEETTGILTLSGQLDYETKNTYLLKIQGEDKGSPSLSNSVLVRFKPLILSGCFNIILTTILLCFTADFGRFGCQ